MKKIVVLVLLVTLSFYNLFAEDAFTGKWSIEIIGSADQWCLTHDDTLTSINVDGNSIDQKIVIDDEQKTIVIPALNMIADFFSYVINEDGTIDLYVTGKFNINLIESFTQSISADDAPNSVSVDAYRKMIIGMENIMHAIPIIRLRKI
jgi:hypothetical protein